MSPLPPPTTPSPHLVVVAVTLPRTGPARRLVHQGHPSLDDARRSLRRLAPDLAQVVVPDRDRLLVFLHGPGLEARRATSVRDAVAACCDLDVDRGLVVTGEGAVELLFRLAAGLTGPDRVLTADGGGGDGGASSAARVRIAWEAAALAGATDPVIDHLVRAALSFGLGVRATATARHPSARSARPTPNLLENMPCAS